MITRYPNETNSISDSGLDRDHVAYQAAHNIVDWTSPALVRIVRLRLLTDVGFPRWDVSYCWGQLKDGTYCRVQLPFDSLGRKTWWGEIAAAAQEAGVNIYRLRLWDAVSKLW